METSFEEGESGEGLGDGAGNVQIKINEIPPFQRSATFERVET